MKAARREVLGLGVAGLALAASGPVAAASSDRGDALARIAAGLVRDGHSAGIQIGVAQADGEPLLAGYGMANLETAAPVTSTSVFRIASCTKQFTAAAILLLAEQGKVALDQTIDGLFAGFPRGDEVTIHQLLTHTSGIHDYTAGGLPADTPGEWHRDPDRHRFIARMEPLFDFDPGTFWSYSNTGYALLGALIEKLSGQSYGEFLRAALLEPAGMGSTAIDEFADIVPGRASGYALEGNVAGAFRNAFWGGLPLAEGGLRSTAADLLRWNGALFGGKILSGASLARMTEPGRVKDGRPSGDARFAAAGQTLGQPPPFVTEPHYGCGLEVCRLFGRRAVWHSGGIRGFNALLFHFPDDRLDLALLANTDNGLVPGFEAFIRAETGN